MSFNTWIVLYTTYTVCGDINIRVFVPDELATYTLRRRQQQQQHKE